MDKCTEIVHQQAGIDGAGKCFFFVQEKKEILGASPAGRVPDPRKSNLHEII